MDQSEWMIYLYKDVLTGKRNKLIYSLLNYDFVQYTIVYEYMRPSSHTMTKMPCPHTPDFFFQNGVSKIALDWLSGEGPGTYAFLIG